MMNKKNAQYAMGGELQSFNSGGSHGENPYGGIPMPNNKSVEQGETKNGNYVFSDRLEIDDNIIEMFGLPKKSKGKTFAQFSKSINKKYTRENDGYENTAKQKELDMLKQAHEVKKNMFMQEMGLVQPEIQPQEQMFIGGAMMAAPAIVSGINLIRTANNKPKAKDLNMFNTDTQFDPNLINRDQIKRDITSSEATAAYDIKNASGGNAGRYLGNRIALNNQANTNLAQANLQSDMADSQEYARVEGMNFNQDLQNQGKRMQVQNWNDADIAAWEGSLQDNIAGIGQNIGNLGTQMVRNKLIKDAYGNNFNKSSQVNQSVNNMNVSNWKNPYTPEAAAIAADEMMSMETALEPPSPKTLAYLKSMNINTGLLGRSKAVNDETLQKINAALGLNMTDLNELLRYLNNI